MLTKACSEQEHTFVEARRKDQTSKACDGDCGTCKCTKAETDSRHVYWEAYCSTNPWAPECRIYED